MAQNAMDVDLDYLFWWTNGGRVPALVSTSPSGTAQNTAGVLPTASVLFGEDRYFDSLRNGGRATLTRWLDEEKTIGFDLGYFGAGHSHDSDYSNASNGSTILARPFFNTSTGAEDAELVAFIDPSAIPIVSGSLRISSSSEFHSGNALFRVNTEKTDSGRLDLLTGYRFFRYRESMNIHEALESTNPFGLIQQGTTLALSDDFNTQSNFHGAELGLSWTKSLDWITLQGTSKIAMGNVQKKLRIRGDTSVQVPSGGSANYQGGLLALPSNIGEYTENDFAFLPELGLKARMLLTKNLDFNVGYTALCLTNVARVGKSIDRRVDAGQLTTLENTGVPSSGNPVAAVPDSVLFANGISFGLGLSR